MRRWINSIIIGFVWLVLRHAITITQRSHNVDRTLGIEMPVIWDTMTLMWCHNVMFHHRFLGSSNQDTYFVCRDRQRVVYEILSTAPYGKRKRAEIGIERLLEEEVFAAAYPMHDVRNLRGWFNINSPPGTKWLPFRKRYFQIHFREWKVLYFDSNFSEVCS